MVNGITVLIDKEKRPMERRLMQVKLSEYHERWKKTIEDKEGIDNAVEGAMTKFLRSSQRRGPSSFYPVHDSDDEPKDMMMLDSGFWLSVGASSLCLWL